MVNEITKVTRLFPKMYLHDETEKLAVDNRTKYFIQ